MTTPSPQSPVPDADDAALLTQFLSIRDVPCPGCGYNLRHLASSRCPECAQEIRLGIHLAEPRQGLLIAGLIGLSAGAGLSGLLLLYGLIAALTMTVDGFSKFFIINGVGFILFGSGLLLWLRRWRQLRRLPGRARAWCVATIWVSVLSFLLVFTFYIN